MNDTCAACFGSGRWGASGSSDTQIAANTRKDRPCDRCIGTGREPLDELVYVLMVNRRVAARLAASKAAA